MCLLQNCLAEVLVLTYSIPKDSYMEELVKITLHTLEWQTKASFNILHLTTLTTLSLINCVSWFEA